MRYLDGELPAEGVARVEEELARSTELRREVAIFRAMHDDLEGMALASGGRGSVWEGVNRRLTRPLGWILFTAGAVLWAVCGAWVYLTSPSDPVQKLAVAALAVGFLILLAGTILERMAEWRTDPYRDVER